MEDQIQKNVREVPFPLLMPLRDKKASLVDMKQVVGKQDILLICLDTLRYDAAVMEEEAGGTPVLNRYGAWEKRQAPGNFTYPSHHAMFAGFLPCQFDAKSIADREMLFFPKQIGMGNKEPKGAFGFSGSTIMEGLEKEGYDTLIYGNKNWLLGEIEPEKLLTQYDVLLNDQSPIPDYPYQFKMWKYSGRQKIAGVENETAYIISFVDYNRR